MTTHISAPTMVEPRTLWEKSVRGRRGVALPEAGVPERPLPELLGADQVRADPAPLPEISEPELVRHFVTTSQENMSIDTTFYPLGSCTMKHNPKLNERVAALPGFADLHPLQDADGAQGTLQVMWELQRDIAEIAGLTEATLQPAAGAAGEFTGLLLIKAFHGDRGEHDQRREIVIPDAAHGTNPASVTLAGYVPVKVLTSSEGGVDLDDLRAKVGPQTAALMLTNPNTLGLFDPNIAEIAGVLHEAGALLYYDGANLNPVMGVSRPGDMGFDVVHFNLHKSFSTPHGGGGPGAGPVAVSDRLAPYLPQPTVRRAEDGRFELDFSREKSIGRVRSFHGNTGVLVRAYTYIRSLGPEGLADAAGTSVLNANYLRSRLVKAGYHAPYGERCMHEFVLSARDMKRSNGVRAHDIAKRLMDFGMHPPTVYFPLLVEECLLIEPTETETLETLNRFADAMEQIAREAAEEPEVVREAPHTTRLGRLDEARAVKQPVLTALHHLGDDPDISPGEDRLGFEAARGEPGFDPAA